MGNGRRHTDARTTRSRARHCDRSWIGRCRIRQGIPPTTSINAQIDRLLSDGETLASKLRAAGVSVTQKTYEGVTHEFFGMSAVHDKAKDANGMAADALKKAYGQ